MLFAKFSIASFSPMRLDSNWESGSRDFYCFVNLLTKQVAQVQENGTRFSNDGVIMQCSDLPLNVCLVRNSVFCGKDAGITIYLKEENLTKMLPAPAELTKDQKIVLNATQSFKSSYGGIKNYRFYEANTKTGIDQNSWDQAKAELIAKSFLSSNGAITDAGRNAIGTERIF